MGDSENSEFSEDSEDSEDSEKSEDSEISERGDGLEVVGEGGEEAGLDEVLVVGVAIVGEGVDRYSSARGEDAFDFDVAGVHESDKVLHYNIDAVLMEITVVSEAEEV